MLVLTPRNVVYLLTLFEIGHSYMHRKKRCDTEHMQQDDRLVGHSARLLLQVVWSKGSQVLVRETHSDYKTFFPSYVR